MQRVEEDSSLFAFEGKRQDAASTFGAARRFYSSPDSSKGEQPAHTRQTVERYHVGRPFSSSFILHPSSFLHFPPDSSKAEQPADIRQTVERYHIGRPFRSFLRSSKAEQSADNR
jgi:hypothetical protein